jgi:dipeptidyl aminopeptidase/acylaminoacyl peptidase
VGDCREALKVLRAQHEVDPAKVGMLGHSEGVFFTMILAGEQDGPKASVLVAGAGRPIKDVLREQILANLKKNPGSGVDEKALMKNYDDTTAQVIATGKIPKTVSPMLASLFPAYIGEYLQKFVSADPLALAKQMNGPVLLMQGSKDIQISPTNDFPVLRKAVESRNVPGTDALVVEGVSHNLKPVEDVNTDLGFEGPASSEALDKIAEWAKKQLG